jgi:hypothetical protein
MVVKSATKKRLMELGVSEEYAHKLATDRNMTDIKNMSHDEVASTLVFPKTLRNSSPPCKSSQNKAPAAVRKEEQEDHHPSQGHR